MNIHYKSHAIKSTVNPRVFWLIVSFFSMLVFLPITASAQQDGDVVRTDSVVSTTATQPNWISRPSTGKSEKIQGTLMLIAGGALSYVGLQRMNEEDPCEGFSRGTCVSNIEEVKTIGAVQLGLGAVSGLIGLVRIGNGMRKAREYEEWKRSNVTVSPVMFHNGQQMQYGFSLHF